MSLSSLLIVAGFIIFAFIILLPLYLLSKYHENIYSILIISVITLVIIYFLVKEMIKKWTRYKNIKYFFWDIGINFIFPLSSITVLIIIETVSFRTLYTVFQFILATIFVILINIILLSLFIFSRRIVFNLKIFLKSKEIN